MNNMILMPLDGSTLSEQALPMARMLAQRLGLVLHLVHVHEPRTTWIDNLPMVDEAEDAQDRNGEERYLASLCSDGGATDMVPTTTTALLDGSPVLALLKEIDRTRPELVVMLTHGRGGIARFWLGSVADQLIRVSPVPVLLERPQVIQDEPRVLHNVLILLDGSVQAEAILNDVVAAFEPLGCMYVLLRVVEPHLPVGYGPMAYGEYLPYTVEPHMIALAEQYLEKVALPLRARGLAVRTKVVADGLPIAAVICDAASSCNADLIAMATHGRGVLGRTVLGSVGDTIIRRASLPVLVYGPAVRHTQHELAVANEGGSTI